MLKDWSRYVKTDAITLVLTIGMMVSMVMLVFTGARTAVGSFASSLRQPAYLPSAKPSSRRFIPPPKKDDLTLWGSKKKEKKEKEEKPVLKPIF